MDEFEVSASVENLHKIDTFISSRLEEAGCPMKTMMKIEIIVDEICGNIVRYSGASFIRVSFNRDEDNSVTLTFTDDGMPYDPLSAKEPDISASLDDRPIGGLGVFIVKNIMDKLSYENKNGRNILTAKKKL